MHLMYTLLLCFLLFILFLFYFWFRPADDDDGLPANGPLAPNEASDSSREQIWSTLMTFENTDCREHGSIITSKLFPRACFLRG